MRGGEIRRRRIDGELNIFRLHHRTHADPDPQSAGDLAFQGRRIDRHARIRPQRIAIEERGDRFDAARDLRRELARRRLHLGIGDVEDALRQGQRAASTGIDDALIGGDCRSTAGDMAAAFDILQRRRASEEFDRAFVYGEVHREILIRRRMLQAHRLDHRRIESSCIRPPWMTPPFQCDRNQLRTGATTKAGESRNATRLCVRPIEAPSRTCGPSAQSILPAIAKLQSGPEKLNWSSAATLRSRSTRAPKSKCVRMIGFSPGRRSRKSRPSHR